MTSPSEGVTDPGRGAGGEVVLVFLELFFGRFCTMHGKLGGGFKHFKHFIFSSLLGEDFQFHSYFSNGLVQPPTS